MPLPKVSSRFPDVRKVLDFALANGGAKYTLTSGGKATHWRQRAYHFRRVLWNEINAANPSPPLPTPYDGIKITIEGNTCVVSINGAEERGVLEPLQPGLVLEAPTEDSTFEAEAVELRKKLGLDL